MALLFTSFHQLFLNSALVNSFCCKKKKLTNPVLIFVMAQAFLNSHMMLWRHFWFFWMHFISEGSSFLFWKHMFGSEGCLKADVFPGRIFSTNYLFIIGHYSRVERRAVQRVTRLLETIMRLADWQTALSQGYVSPAECVFSQETKANGWRPTGSMYKKYTNACELKFMDVCSESKKVVGALLSAMWWPSATSALITEENPWYAEWPSFICD